jgi:hypothetical protein
MFVIQSLLEIVSKFARFTSLIGSLLAHYMTGCKDSEAALSTTGLDVPLVSLAFGMVQIHFVNTTTRSNLAKRPL